MTLPRLTTGRGRPLAVGAVILASCAAMSATSASVVSHPPSASGSAVRLVGAVSRLSARHRLSASQWVEPVASTTSHASFDSPYAVFARHNRTPDGDIDASGELLALTKNHHVEHIGTITSDMGTFSLSGYTLTAPSESQPHTVYWWQPPTAGRPYQKSSVTSGDRYLTSAPDGWVEIDGNGTLYDEDAGASTPAMLAHPFAALTDHDVSAISGPSGVVVWNDSQIAFVSFATHHVTPLDTSAVTTLSGGTDTPECWSASTTAVACGSYYDDGEDDSGIKNVFIDPLSGASAIASSSSCPQPATVLGATVAWAGCNERLTILSSAGTSKTRVRTFDAPVAGLGKFLTTRAGTVGVGVSPTSLKVSTLLPAAKAVTEASAFALTEGAVYWKEDDAGPTPHPIAVRRRSLRVNSYDTGVTAGRVKSLGSSTSAQPPLAASGSTVVYAARNTASSLGQHAAAALRVVSPKRRFTLHGVDRYDTVAVAGHRLLYFVAPDRARLYNLKTRSVRTVTILSGTLSGHYFAYATTDGRILLEDFTTGHVATVATGNWSAYGEVPVFLYHQEVGWSPVTSTGQTSYYRNMASSRSTPTALPGDQRIWALTKYGVVTVASRKRPTTDYLLWPYGSGNSDLLLALRWPAVAGPQIAGRLIGWIDDEGRLEVSALS